MRRGDVLVELDGEQARADLAVAEAALAESRSQYQRSRELYTTKVLSDAQIEQIEATFKANEARVASARSRLGDTVVRAPFAGRVGLRRISVGSLISPGTVITTLDDTSSIKLDFTIPETFVSAVQTGLKIVARSVSYPDESFEGTVSSIDTRVDPATRSVTVRALLPNPKGLLKPGMFLTVRLSRGAVDAVMVPEEALVPEQGDMFVFVVKDGVAEKRPVRIGQRRVGDVQVVEGLADGELVVTEGTQKLRDGAAVAVQAAEGRVRVMKISTISVQRPVFATVVSLLLVILGLLALTRLPVRELPDVEAPIVSIETDYRGASADVVETKITQVIEDRVSGLEGITKITSQSVDGRSSINLEFDPARSVDDAANDVRDRVARVASNLPPEADPPEIGKVDFNADPIIWLNLSSSTLDVLELTDYAERVIAERLGVLPGVARVRFGGARRYAMRVWIDREALAARQLTVADIESALRRENVQLPAGRLESSQRELTLRTETGLNTEQDFRGLVIGRGADGYLVRLSEVADVRLAAENERSLSRSNTVPGISIGVEQISKANTLEVAAAVRDGTRAAAAAAAGGHGARGQPRPLRVHRGVDARGRDRARDRAAAGAAGHLPVPRQRAGDADPGRDDPGVDHRVVPGHGRARLLDQRADAARAGARDRPGRGRRDRRAREHLPAHGNGRAAADRGRRRQPRDRLRGDRHDAGADGGVRADLVPAGQRRPAVPRVRLHDRGRGAVLVAGRADADADDELEAAGRRRHADAAVGCRRPLLPRRCRRVTTGCCGA